MFPTLTPAVRLLLLINAGVFLLNAALGGALIGWFGLSGEAITSTFGLGAYRLISYQFVHSYLFIGHILGNMLGLYFLGTFVERSIGYRGLIKLYLGTGLCGGLLQLVFAALAGEWSTPTVGASGAVYGILLYAACRAPRTTFMIYGVIPVVLGWIAGIAVFIALYDTMLYFREGVGGGVAHGGHLGGALGGYLAYRFFATHLMVADHRPWLGGLGARVQEMRTEREARTRAEQQRTLDELLDKVHREGMHSLTDAERKALERVSRDLKKR